MNTAEQVLSRSLTLITHQHRQILLRDSEVDWVKETKLENLTVQVLGAGPGQEKTGDVKDEIGGFSS